MMLSLAVLNTALLFGGMTLYSFGVTREDRGRGIASRLSLVPHVRDCHVGCGRLALGHRDAVCGAVMAAVAATTLPAPQPPTSRAWPAPRKEKGAVLEGSIRQADLCFQGGAKRANDDGQEGARALWHESAGQPMGSSASGGTQHQAGGSRPFPLPGAAADAIDSRQTTRAPSHLPPRFTGQSCRCSLDAMTTRG